MGTGAATAGDAGNADDAGNVDDADDAGDDVVVTAAADVASFWFKGRRRRTRGEGELFAVNTCHSQRNNNNNNYNNYNIIIIISRASVTQRQKDISQRRLMSYKHY